MGQIRKWRLDASAGIYEVTLQDGSMQSVDEVIVLDFDGAENVAYRNTATGTVVENVTVTASVDAAAQAVVLETLNASAPEGVVYITADEAAEAGLQAKTYSTIYVGETDDLDVLGTASSDTAEAAAGSDGLPEAEAAEAAEETLETSVAVAVAKKTSGITFLGIAETTGEDAAATRGDNAFVLTNNIDTAEELAEVIAHEAGHLTGTVTHDNGNDGVTIDDFMDDTPYTTRQNIVSGSTFTISAGDTFTAPLFSGNGGAIYASKGGILKGGGTSGNPAVFSGNSATSGGAVFISGSVNLSNVCFSNNIATSSGGAAWITGGTTILGGSFLSNFALSRGGALYTTYTLTISSTLFEDNHIDAVSGNAGGAAFIWGGAVSATIVSAVFRNNGGYGSGGALWDSQETLLSDTKFYGNSATLGGAYYLHQGTDENHLATVSGGIFSANSATSLGGAIAGAAGHRLAIQGNTVFSANSAGGNGGAIHAYNIVEISADVAGSSALFECNRAVYGGAICFVGNQRPSAGSSAATPPGWFTQNGGTFLSNIATGNGGAIYGTGGTSEVSSITYSRTMSFTGVTFSGNSAAANGGAIFGNSGLIAGISGGAFYANSAQSGGAISINGNMTVSGTVFSGNRVLDGLGGAIYNGSGELDIDGAQFISNWVSGHITSKISGSSISIIYSGGAGGAIYNSGASLAISNGVFSGNSAAYSGGALYTSGTANLSGTYFSANTASLGGAVFARGATTILGGSFLSNSAVSRGGGLYMSGNNIVISTYNGSATVFEGNCVDTADGGGAFIWAIENSAKIESAVFRNNSAQKNGGGLWLSVNDPLLLDTEFYGNSATYGGAVYLHQGSEQNHSATISGGTFFGNSARYGGAVGGASGYQLAISGSTVFSANSATMYGGAIYANNEVEISADVSGGSALFARNHATSGGAIYFAGNQRIGSGSGASAVPGGFTQSGGMFLSNTATGNGGAVYGSGGTSEFSGTTYSRTMSFTGVTFSGNSATSGGAIFNCANMTLNTVTFSGNSAKTSGGAIYNSAGAALTLKGLITLGTATDTIVNCGAMTWDVSGAAARTTENAATISDYSLLTNDGTLAITVTAAQTFGHYTLGYNVENASGDFTLKGYNGDATYTLMVGDSFEYNDRTYTLTLKDVDGDSKKDLVLDVYTGRQEVTTSAILGTDSAAHTSAITSNGGAYYVSAGGTLSAYGAMNYNSAASGGAIYVENGGSVTLSGAMLSGNTAASGGALYNAGSAVIWNTVFGDDGDTICNAGTATLSGTNTFGGTFTNTGTVIFGDSAVVNGTIVNSGTLNLDGCTELTLGGSGALTGTGMNLSGKTLILDRDAVDSKAHFTDMVLSGAWSGVTSATVLFGSDTSSTVALGSCCYDSAYSRKLWFGSYNSTFGLTDAVELYGGATETFGRVNDIANISKIYSNYDGTVNMAGGTFSSIVAAGALDLAITGAVTTTKYIVGGARGAAEVASNTLKVDAAVTATNTILIAGNQYLTTDTGADVSLAGTAALNVTANAAGTAAKMLVAGNLMNGTAARNYTYTTAHDLTIAGSVTSKYAFGSHIVGGASNVTENGDITVSISAGTYTYVSGAGYIQSKNAALTQTGDVSMTLSGGTYTNVYGGALGSSASYVAKTNVTGKASITVDTSKNVVTLQFLAGGSSSNSIGGIMNGSTEITFTGLGSNLQFIDNGRNAVRGGHATAQTYSMASGETRTLTFDAFSGNFGFVYVEAFDNVNFKNSSTVTSKVTFTSSRIDLSGVKNWNFADGTKLTWGTGTNNFSGDTLSFGTTASDTAWTVIDGGSDALFANLASASSVSIYGTAAEKVLNGEVFQYWKAGDYKLAVDSTNHDLVISKIA